MRMLALHASLASIVTLGGCCFPRGDDDEPNGAGNDANLDKPLALATVHYWAYQIQGLEEDGAVDALVQSKYDLLVLEPTRTDFVSEGSRDFNTAGMVARIKASAAHDGQHRKLLLAYIDIGEAENWRWYWTWSADWPAGQPRPAGWPGWIVTPDPDGWAGNFPVAFWDAAWKDIVIYGTQHPPAAGRDFVSVLDEVIKDGFDGVYLDWVEVYSDSQVIKAAQAAGVDPKAEIAKFIEEIRAYGRQRNPGFIVIQQNAPELIEDNPQITGIIDGIGQEDTWFSGQADKDWDDPQGYGQARDSQESLQIQRLLDLYRAAGKPVFTIDYTVSQAGQVYAQAAAKGYVGYCSRTSLSRLTTTPPPGY
jgi:cysteinyl-tRNA synthetase